MFQLNETKHTGKSAKRNADQVNSLPYSDRASANAPTGENLTAWAEARARALGHRHITRLYNEEWHKQQKNKFGI